HWSNRSYNDLSWPASFVLLLAFCTRPLLLCRGGNHSGVWVYMRYWLMKSEPSVVGIDDVLKMPNKTVDWWGVRNYQARNFMRDQMSVGDGVFFYHSSCPEPGIAGIARVAKKAYPDRLQFDPASEYYDPKSTPEDPRWMNVEVQCAEKR